MIDLTSRLRAALAAYREARARLRKVTGEGAGTPSPATVGPDEGDDSAREDIARHRSGLRRTGEATPSRRAESVKPVRNTTAVVPTARSAREESARKRNSCDEGDHR